MASVNTTITSAISISGQFLPNHGDPNILCLPAKPLDVLIFFFLNYVAHAATLKTVPGESTAKLVLDIVMALFIPVSGTLRGLRAIIGAAKFADTDLRAAARAGALCTVVQWPLHCRADVPKTVASESSKPIWRLFETAIHGSYHLPPGFALAIVPPEAHFENDHADTNSILEKVISNFQADRCRAVKISCSYSTVKVAVTLVQLLYGCTTLYQSRGAQIGMYGFAAFGLTAAPYAWMSLINLIANILCPEYPAIYLVESETMRLLQGNPTCGSTPKFTGVVGRLTATSDYEMMRNIERLASLMPKNGDGRKELRRLTFSIICSFVVALGPLVIIGALSGFNTGQAGISAPTHTVSIWLGTGVIFGIVELWSARAFEDRPIVNFWARNSEASRIARVIIASCCVLGSVAILVWIEVAKMIYEYGICTQIN